MTHCIPIWRRIILSVFRVQVMFTQQALEIRSRPCIVICNHQSLLDGVIIALASPANLDYAVTPRYAVENAVTRLGLRFLSGCGLGRVIPLSSGRTMSIRTLRRSLIEGRSVMIFPTGKITPGEDQRGYAWLSHRTGCPVIRASISGVDQSCLFAKNGKRLWPRIRIEI